MMVRSVTEWIGKTDDTPPSVACKRRILNRQDSCCALTGKPFTDKDKPFFDHKVPLWLGGANRETNLHAIRDDPHKAKTAAEAKVRSKVNANIDKRFALRTTTGKKIPTAPKTISERTAAKIARGPKAMPPRRSFYARWEAIINPEHDSTGD